MTIPPFLHFLDETAIIIIFLIYFIINLCLLTIWIKKPKHRSFLSTLSLVSFFCYFASIYFFQKYNLEHRMSEKYRYEIREDNIPLLAKIYFTNNMAINAAGEVEFMLDDGTRMKVNQAITTERK